MDTSASRGVILCNSSLASKSCYMRIEHVRIYPSVHQQHLVRWQSGWHVFSCVRKRLRWSYCSALTKYHQSGWALLPGPYCNCLYFTRMKSTWKGAMGGYLGMVVSTEFLYSSAWSVKLEPLLWDNQMLCGGVLLSKYACAQIVMKSLLILFRQCY